MNFDPQPSTQTAVNLALIASFLWGSWAIILKYTIKLPLDTFYQVPTNAALVFILGLGFVLDGSALIEAIRSMFASDPDRVLLTLLGGFFSAVTNSSSVLVVQRVGLALAQPISGSLCLILGTTVSCFIGGIPEDMPIWRLFLAGGLLIAAIFFSFLLAKSRPEGHAAGRGKFSEKVFFFTIIAVMTGVIYSSSISYGLKSFTQPNGLATMPYLSLFVSGVWLGALIFCGYLINKHGEWDRVRRPKPRLLLQISIASWTHYGGNVRHVYATRHLSSVQSWPLGTISGLWVQIWRLPYGEFKGSSKKLTVFHLPASCLTWAGLP
jgi:hypothetical protein